MNKILPLFALAATGLTAMAQSELPTFTAKDKLEAATYYHIRFKNGGVELVDKGANAKLSTAYGRKNDAQLFAFIGTKDNFVLRSKNGNYLAYLNNRMTSVKEAAKAEALSILNSPNFGKGYYVIARKSDSGNSFNPFGGTGVGKEIGFWSNADVNNSLYFPLPDDVPTPTYSAYRDEFTKKEYVYTANNSFNPERPLTLWYVKPAMGVANPWMEYSLPLGNGHLGASLFGGIKVDQIQLNEKTIWTGTPTVIGNHGGYHNLGGIFVHDLSENFNTTDKKAFNYNRFLDIERGVGGVNFSDKAGTKYERRYFSSAPDDVVAAHYKATGDNKLHLRFALVAGEDINASNPKYDENGEVSFAGKLPTVYYNARMKVVPTGGTMTVTKEGVEVKDATEVKVIFSAASTFDGSVPSRSTGDANTVAAKVQDIVTKAAAKSWAELESAHVADFESYMGRVKLNLDNASTKRNTQSLITNYNLSDASRNSKEGLFLEQLYFNYGRYLMISSSRGAINVPSNLQGIWNDKAEAPWNSDIHTNINVQMNYWPAETTNLSDCHLPFLNYILDNYKREGWQKAARWGDDGQKVGWTVFTESNIFGGMSTWGGNYKEVNAWYCTHLWDHYRFTRDEAFLRKAFPAIWQSAQFWMERMIQDKVKKDGTFVAPNEYSPEQNDHPTEDGTAHAQQLITANLQIAQDAINILGAESLGLSAADVAQLKNYVEKTDKGLHIEEYKGDWGDWAKNLGINKGTKLLKEWKYASYSVSKDKGHRHMSHLMCLYPLNQVERGDDYFQPAVNALTLRGDAATGWSMGWKVNLWARAKDGDHARRILNNALKHSTSYGTDQYQGGIYYNLYDSHAPFQIDGNFGVCAGMAEMLLQSQNEVIEVLPALPRAWKNGSVTGLKAVGNFTVDVAWKNLLPSEVKIVSHLGLPLRVKVAGNTQKPGEEIDPYKFDLTLVKVLVNGRGAKVIPVETKDKKHPTFEIKALVNGELKDVPAGATVTIDFSAPAVPTGIGLVKKEDNKKKQVFGLDGRAASTNSHGILVVNGQKVMQ
jgi:hypothetical protein